MKLKYYWKLKNRKKNGSNICGAMVIIISKSGSVISIFEYEELKMAEPDSKDKLIIKIFDFKKDYQTVTVQVICER
jgi:hypothetical protein